MEVELFSTRIESLTARFVGGVDGSMAVFGLPVAGSLEIVELQPPRKRHETKNRIVLRDIILRNTVVVMKLLIALAAIFSRGSFFMSSGISRVLRIVNLPKSTTEDDVLVCLNFKSDGLRTLKLVHDAEDESICLGYGYLHFETADDASRALSKYQGKSIPTLGVRFNLSFSDYSEGAVLDFYQVFVGSLPESMTSDELFRVFKKYSDDVCNARVVCDERGISKRYGFVQFTSDESARKTISKVSLMDTGLIVRETHTRSRAEIERQVDHINNKVIFIGNLNLSITDADLHTAMSRFGFVESVRIVSGKGFGFVQFGDHVSALAALSELQNSELFHQRVHCSWGEMRSSSRPVASGIDSEPLRKEPHESLEYHASMLPSSFQKRTKLSDDISTEEKIKLLEQSLTGQNLSEPPLKSIAQINEEYIVRKFNR